MVGRSHLNACTKTLPRYFLAMLSLTRREQVLVVSVLLAFGAGLAIKHWRETRQMPVLTAGSEKRP